MSNSPTADESIEDLVVDVKGIETDNTLNSQYRSSCEASPVSDNGSSLEQEKKSISPPDRGKKSVGTSWKSFVSSAEVYFQKNIVPSDVRIDDGFYDPGRAEDMPFDQDVLPKIPALTSYFDHDNCG